MLDVNFGAEKNYPWCFTAADLNFCIIGIDFLTACQLTVDSFNCCLIDQNQNLVIPLSPVYFATPPKICWLCPEKSEFHKILSDYPNILNPPHRHEQKSPGIEHAIHSNGEIVHSKPRRTSEVQKIINSQISEWLMDGIVSRNDSPYSSCLHVVPKKSGKHRVCVDFRNLDATCVLESYPIPHLHSMMNNLFGSKVFSVLDLKSADFNVPIRKQDRPKTAFSTKSACY